MAMLYLVFRRNWAWRLEVSFQARSQAHTVPTALGLRHHLPQMAVYLAT